MVVDCKNDLNLNTLQTQEIEKLNAFVVAEILEYIPHSVTMKTIMRKITGNVTILSFDSGETLGEKISPFDTLIQIIDGKGEILINGATHKLTTGESIIIPAHAHGTITANERFKMISTIIKSGYEEVS